ncbi:MAG: hypothetical protein ACR2MW_10320, partial [Chthoniobacterales bacterium]
MKRPLLGLLCATVALTSCQTAHRAAVGTFRVIDAPHEYLRRQLNLDEQGNEAPADGTTTTTTTYSQTNAPRYNQTYQQQVPPPRYSAQRRVVENNPPPQRQVVTEQTREEQAPPSTPTPAPRVTSRSSTSSSSNSTDASSSSTKTTSASSSGGLLYAKPVPGKAGYVFSPYDKNGGYVDVTGFAPGSKVKDPYSGKVFLVP